MDKSQACWNITANTPVILTELFCDETELYHDRALLWGNIDIIAKIQLLYVNMWYDNVEIDNQMHWEIQLNPPQVVIPMENGWSEAKLDLAEPQFISMLNGSAQGDYNVWTT